MKIRFSLRLFLIVFTLATIFFALRYNQRANINDAARNVKRSGGTAHLQRKKPRIVSVPTRVRNVVFQISVPYTVTLPDGSTETRTRMEMAGRNVGYNVQIDEIRFAAGNPPGFSIGSFLTGSNSDIAISAISIPAIHVDTDLVDSLEKLDGLKDIVLCMNQEFFGIEASTRMEPERKTEELKRLGKHLNEAVNLLKSRLPNTKIHQRGLLDPT